MLLEADPQTVRRVLVAYHQSSWRRGLLEIAVTAGPLAAFWLVTLATVAHVSWWGLLFAPFAAVFLVRLFMIQHDCGHQAFFPARAANEWTGRVIGVLTMTPYDYWRQTHAIHHATSGNLDRRWLGAVETLTVSEYAALPAARRLAYRLYRHPLVMLGLGPGYMFVLQHRLPIGLMRDRRAWLSVMGNNAGLAMLLAAEIAWVGVGPALAAHIAIVLIAATIGVWLFYVQHQFEETYWERQGRWTAHDAAFRGSSHLDLPAPLRWLTANIGAHHLHHASSRIPFYRLPEVMRDHPELRNVCRLTLRDACRALSLALYDEDAGRLVSFRQAGARARQGRLDSRQAAPQAG